MPLGLVGVVLYVCSFARALVFTFVAVVCMSNTFQYDTVNRLTTTLRSDTSLKKIFDWRKRELFQDIEDLPDGKPIH